MKKTKPLLKSKYNFKIRKKSLKYKNYQSFAKQKNNTLRINKIKINKKKEILYDYISINGILNDNIKENQDKTLIYTDFLNNKKIYIFGVFDGHGKYGSDIAYFSKIYLLKGILYLIEKNILKEKYIIKIFDKCQKKLISKFKSQLSGTTANILIIINDNYFSINLGDSRSIIFNNKKEISFISKDHNLNNIKEKTRIINSGGIIKKINNIPRLYDYFGNGQGWNMSRTLGDVFSHNIGIINEPDTKFFKINSKNIWIILASDGLFYPLENNEIIDIVLKYKESNIYKILKELVIKSREIWINKYNYIDDISIILVKINN